MENKLTIIEIRYIRALAAVKTDEQLAEMIEKPVELIKAQFALMAGLPRRPGEKIIINDLPPKPDQIGAGVMEQKQIQKAPKIKKIRSTGKKRISHAERKLIRDQKNAEIEKQKHEKQSIHTQEQGRLNDRKKKLERSKFKTRVLDLSNTIRVQLNAKTTVWVKPGTDIEQLKKKYNIR